MQVEGEGSDSDEEMAGDVGIIGHTNTEEWDDDDSELDDIRINTTDHLLLTTKNTELTPELNVFLYDPHYDNVYLHHDATVSAFPTAVEWLGRAGGQEASVAAVGTFGPAIELWNTNVLHAIAPDAFLGGCRKVGDNIRYTSAPYPEEALRADSHRGPTLGLAWNRIQQDGLASCSADGTVKLWSTLAMECVQTFTGIHSGLPKGSKRVAPLPVSTIQWAPNSVGNGFVFLSAGHDGTVAVTDGRLPPQAATVGRINVAAVNGKACATESICVVGGLVIAATDKGDIVGADLRAIASSGAAAQAPVGGKGSVQPGVVWNLKSAHTPCPEMKSAETVVAAPCGVGGESSTAPFFASAGFDQAVRLWDLRTPVPTPLETATVPGVGRILSMAFAPDDIGLVAAAGDGGQPLVYSIATVMRPHFPDLFPAAPTTAAVAPTPDGTARPTLQPWERKEAAAERRTAARGRVAVEAAAHQLATRRIAPRTGRPGGTGDRRRRKAARRAEEGIGGGRVAPSGGAGASAGGSR